MPQSQARQTRACWKTGRSKTTAVFFTMPRIAVLRGMVLSHVIHHRGQLTVYLQLTGAKVPGMYGPSADEVQPGTTASAA